MRLVDSIKITCQKRDIIINLNFELNTPHGAFVHGFLSRGVSYEPEITSTMFRILQEGHIAIDVGANMGYFSIIMSKLVGSTGRIYAFEPLESARDNLFVHINANNSNNIVVSAAPLWKASEEVTFWVNSDDESSSALWDIGTWFDCPKSRASPRPEKRHAKRLDDFWFAEHESIRLIKLDTEGTELDILRGGNGLLTKQHVPFIISELNPFGLKTMGTDAEEFRGFMHGFGYDAFFMREGGQLPIYVPPKTRIEYADGVRVTNILFASMDDVQTVWATCIDGN